MAIAASTLKVGDILYAVFVDGEEGTHQLEEWHVRTIRDGKVHLIEKCESTWVKLSKKNGDYGWAEKIGEWRRESVRQPRDLPEKFSRTKVGAYRAALPEVARAHKKLTRLLGSIRGSMTKVQSAKKRASAAVSTATSRG